jgi:hypothetical protein
LFFFLNLSKEPFFIQPWTIKDFVNPTGCASWNCCSTWCWGYMYQFLDEMDIDNRFSWKNPEEMRVLEIVKIMFFSIRTVSTLLAIWSIWIKMKPNEKAKQHKTRANRMELQNVRVLQFVKSFTIYYIKCVCPRIWVNMLYVQELRWE